MSQHLHVVAAIPIHDEDIVLNELAYPCIQNPVSGTMKKLFKTLSTKRVWLKMPDIIPADFKFDKVRRVAMMPTDFKRECDGLLKYTYRFLVIDRLTSSVTIKEISDSKTKQSFASALFIQAVQLQSPSNPALTKIHHQKSNDISVNQQQNYFNSRNTCCFKNIVVINLGDKAEFGIMPHNDCDIDPYSAVLVYSKVKKWYCLK